MLIGTGFLDCTQRLMSVGKIIIFYLHKASGNYHINLMVLKREVTAKKELD